MQRWSKFQFQSKNLNRKISFVILTILLVSLIPQTFAQEIGTLIDISDQKIIFEVGKNSKVHVKHIIETGNWNPNAPKYIEIFSGGHSNIQLADEDGDPMGYGWDGVLEGRSFEDAKYIILEQKLGCCDIIAEYDLENFLELKNGMWKKGINHQAETIFMFDDDIDMVFINSRPIELNTEKGINCIGCNMTLEFWDDERVLTKEILYDDVKYEIEISTNEEISELEFFGGSILNFDVKDDEQLFVLKIPFELFLNPFDVYLTEKDDMDLEQIDKIRKTEFSQDEKYVKLSFKTNMEGTVSIVGATQEAHERKLEQMEKIMSNAQEKEVVDDVKGIPIPIPGKMMDEIGSTEVPKKPELSFVDELKEKQVQNTPPDYVNIIIIGIIISVVIIGIIIKLKKN